MSTHNDTFKWKANFSMLMNDVVNHGWISVLPPMYRVGSGDQDTSFLTSVTRLNRWVFFYQSLRYVCLIKKRRASKKGATLLNHAQNPQ